MEKEGGGGRKEKEEAAEIQLPSWRGPKEDAK